ncbi:MAG: carbohydrate ABC transporter substrate-binding protein [Clostridia bacterium]|nr:carbohydrate ABC transporter substrate-binding protein [Clostridia bacterium]
MQYLKRMLATTLCAVTALSSVFALSACGGDTSSSNRNKGPKDPAKTITIASGEGGNGSEWLYTLADKFEKAYQEEGYRVNVLEPSNDMAGTVALTDMARGVEETGTDMYFISGINSVDAVGEDGDYGVLAEDLAEIVFNQPAIGYDGEEESVLISSKIRADRMRYSIDKHGKAYGFQYNDTVSGLAVNMKKFNKYGLELPKTTNEFLQCMQTIYLGTDTVPNAENKKGHFPITYVGGNNGYVVSALSTWMAQYDYDAYEQFWSMHETDAEGNVIKMETNGYEVFKMKSVEEMLTVAYAAMDVRAAAYGSTTQGLDQAQAQVMKENGGAVMMFNGSWMMNEVKLNWKNQVNDITFIGVPVISALGTKLMGNGTSYNLSDEKCDEVLSFVIGLVDENKEIDEMITAVKEEFDGLTLSEAVVTEIARARGFVYVRGVEALGLINKNTPRKNIAALFLRMMASEDFAQTWYETANSAPVYSRNLDLSKASTTFVREAVKISLNKYQVGITGPRNVNGLRESLGLRAIFTHTAHIPSTISTGAIVSMFDGKGNIGKDAKGNALTVQVYRDAAKKMQETEYNNAKKYWKDYYKNAGLPIPEGVN